MAIKVCILTVVHRTFDTRIFYKEARSLAKAGYDVTLIAPHDKVEIVDGIRIIPLSKPKNRIERMTKIGWMIFKLALKEQADIYHFHDPELIPLGLFLKVSGKKVVMDIHEDYKAQIQGKSWIPRPLRRIFSFLVRVFEKIGVIAFDGVVTTDEALAKQFSHRKASGFIISAENYPIISSELRVLDIIKARYEERRILFLGGISDTRCTREFITALEILNGLPFEAWIGGNIIDEKLLHSLKGSSSWNKVKFLGRVPVSEVTNLMLNSSIAINLYSNQPNHYSLRSNRLFESLAAGLPVIVSNFPMSKAFVERNNCGIAVNPENSEEIASAINELLLNPDRCMRLGLNGRDAVFKNYDWESQAVKIIELYNNIANKI
jgi:glycosyltransferase involved in cell wall biosynthesis